MHIRCLRIPKCRMSVTLDFVSIRNIFVIYSYSYKLASLLFVKFLLSYIYKLYGSGSNLKICICDDDKNIHSILTSYLQDFTTENSKFEIIDYFCAEELLDNYANNPFDIIFLDIEMGHKNGIEAAETIRQTYTKTIIVFISSFPHYVFDSFRVEALHFLVKPISKMDFENVFNRALFKYKSINSTISLKWQNERYVIKVDTIKYIEGYKRHITVYTQYGAYEAIGKIPDILNELSPHGFIRTHQGFIVNMDYIKRFDTTDVVLFDGTKVMISVRKRAEALQAFDKYLKNRKW